MKCIVCFSFNFYFASGYNFPFSLHVRGPDSLLMLLHPVHSLLLFCRLNSLSITSRLTVDLFLALTTTRGQPRLLLVRILFDEVHFNASFEGKERRAMTESERKRIPYLCSKEAESTTTVLFSFENRDTKSSLI